MPEKCAYIRAVGGISGDMLLGALIDVEADIDFITQQLNSLNPAVVLHKTSLMVLDI